MMAGITARSSTHPEGLVGCESCCRQKRSEIIHRLAITRTSAVVVSFRIARAFKAEHAIFFMMCRTLSVPDVVVDGGTLCKENVYVRSVHCLRVLHLGVKFILTRTARQEKLPKLK